MKKSVGGLQAVLDRRQALNVEYLVWEQKIISARYSCVQSIV
jgi:hypothetical protein